MRLVADTLFPPVRPPLVDRGVLTGLDPLERGLLVGVLEPDDLLT